MLDRANVPVEFHPWIPLAEKWAIGDDFDRERAVDEIDERGFAELVGFSDAYDGVAEWLAGPESHREPLTPEYLAFTHLTMAWDSLKVAFGAR